MAAQQEPRAAPPRRSAGALRERRVPQPWPEDRDFRILSLDGGGIRGIFPAAVLAGLEARYLGGRSVAQCFDLITGTSTGGILAIGLAAGLTATALRDVYVERGGEIFPPLPDGIVGGARRRLRSASQYFRYRYDRDALVSILTEMLGHGRLGAAQARLCIPSFDGRYGEVYIFKTPHHPDFKKDAYEHMVKVASATAAVPTFFQPLPDGGYTFVDGGVWANNPIMVGVVDALSFSTYRGRVSLS
jgi:patatin-like phospholipase/acyl hydrolase